MNATTKILAAMALGLGLVAGLQTIRVHQLKADAAKTEAAHATALAKAERDQAEAVAAVTIAEKQRAAALERDVSALTAKLKTMRDYHADLAPVLHLRIDSMHNHAAEPGGLVPADSQGPARTRTVHGRAAAGES